MMLKLSKEPRWESLKEDITRYADMLAAMGTEPRLRIMRLLPSAHPEGLVVGEIGTELEISPSTLSHHPNARFSGLRDLPLWRHTIEGEIPENPNHRSRKSEGGCGKTTSAVAITSAFSSLGYSACLADTDPQCNATESFGIRAESIVDEGKFTLADAYLKKKPAADIEVDFGRRFEGRLTLLPGNRGLSSIPLKLENELQIAIADGEKTTLDADEMRSEQRVRLRRSLDTLRDKRDVVVIDTPPSLDFLMVSTLVAADWFIIPVFPSGYFRRFCS